MVILAVTIRCKKEKKDEAKEFFQSFVPRARSEAGCIQYDLMQADDDEQKFYFFEKWADRATFDLHSQQPYLKEFHSRFSELLAQPNEVTYLAQI
jgi:quinol monooxygenase YgiN